LRCYRPCLLRSLSHKQNMSDIESPMASKRILYTSHALYMCVIFVTSGSLPLSAKSSRFELFSTLLYVLYNVDILNVNYLVLVTKRDISDSSCCFLSVHVWLSIFWIVMLLACKILNCSPLDNIYIAMLKSLPASDICFVSWRGSDVTMSDCMQS